MRSYSAAALGPLSSTISFDDFEDGVSAGIAEVLRDANVTSGDLALLARLLFVAADAALHQVVLPMSSAGERARAIDELARLLSQGLVLQASPHRPKRSKSR
jgi:hypothetical protein